MSCSKNCMQCQSEIVHYVNFSKYHGLCQEHFSLQKKIQICRMCKSYVPILMTGYECTICKKNYSEKNLDCLHSICPSCKKEFNACIICKPYVCAYCQANYSNFKDCGHILCDICFSLESKCPLCNESFVEEKSNNCEYCLNLKGNARNECKHIICGNCFDQAGQNCPLCLKLIEEKQLNNQYLKENQVNVPNIIKIEEVKEKKWNVSDDQKSFEKQNKNEVKINYPEKKKNLLTQINQLEEEEKIEENLAEIKPLLQKNKQIRSKYSENNELLTDPQAPENNQEKKKSKSQKKSRDCCSSLWYYLTCGCLSTPKDVD